VPRRELNGCILCGRYLLRRPSDRPRDR